MSTMKVNSIADAAGTGAPTMSFGLKLPTAGGTAGTLDHYEEYSDTLTWTHTAATTTGTLKIRRLGKLVVCELGGITLTTGATPNPIDSASGIVPSRFRPPLINEFTAVVVNNSVVQTGAIHIRSDGQIRVFSSVDAGNFTNGVTCGFPRNSANTFVCAWVIA